VLDFLRFHRFDEQGNQGPGSPVTRKAGLGGSQEGSESGVLGPGTWEPDGNITNFESSRMKKQGAGIQRYAEKMM